MGSREVGIPISRLPTGICELRFPKFLWAGKQVLTEFAVDGRRVVYAGESKGEKRTYCAESPRIIRRFFSLYPNFPKNIAVFFDVGNCFFEDGKDVLLELGFVTHKM